MLNKNWKPEVVIVSMAVQHYGILDQDHFADSNYRLPLEMFIFEGKSTSRKLKLFACGAY